MPEATGVPVQRPRPTRRRVVRDVAWALPTIVLASAAPAAAASPAPCPAIPAAAAWAVSFSNFNPFPNSGPLGWGSDAVNGSKFQVVRDNGSMVANAVATTSTSITVTAGVTYNFSLRVYAGPGNPVPNGNATIAVAVAGQTIFSGHTQTGAGVALQETGDFVAYAASYPATTSGLVGLSITVVDAPLAGVGASTDDISILLPSLSSCTHA